MTRLTYGISNGRDRDRTDDLYRVKVGPVIYVIDPSQFVLHDSGSFLMMFGAYCSQLVPRFWSGKHSEMGQRSVDKIHPKVKIDAW